MKPGGFIPFHDPGYETGMKPGYANPTYETGMKPGQHF